MWFSGIIPQRVALDLGFAQIYWYSIFMLVAILAAYGVARSLYLRKFPSDKIFTDLAFYLVPVGLVGARLWHVFVFQWGYYSQQPSEILKIWHGGIAIQGAIVAGIATIYIFSRLHKLHPLWVLDCVVVGVPLGQAIGRWGNFFNQELYGGPTALPWAIFIEPANRVAGFEQFSYFHPTFFYESLLSLLLFFFLWRQSRKQVQPGVSTAVYLFGYSLIRFFVDFLRVDPMPMILSLRLSQYISILFIIAAFFLYRFAIRQRS